MHHAWKLFGILTGTSFVVVSFWLLADTIPSFTEGYFLSITAAVTGAIWAAITEEKAYQQKQLTAQVPIKQKAPISKEPPATYTLINSVQQRLNALQKRTELLLQDEKYLEEEEKLFLNQAITEDVRSICKSFANFTPDIQELKKDDIFTVLAGMNKVCSQMEEMIEVRKEREFEYAKRVLQEKLKRR